MKQTEDVSLVDATEQPEFEAVETDEAPVAEPDAEAAESDDDKGTSEEKPKGGWQRRIDKLTRRNYQLEAELEAARKQQLAAKPAGQQPDGKPEAKASTTAAAKPDPKKFENYDDYAEALTEWKVDQRLAAEQRKAAEWMEQQHAAEVARTYAERTDKLRAKHDDFDEALESIEDITFSREFQTAVFSSELGAELAYHLAKNRAEAERLGKLSLQNPLAAVRELGKLEAKLTPAPAAKPKTISSAPEPVTPVSRASRAAVKPLHEITDFNEYERRRRAGERP